MPKEHLRKQILDLLQAELTLQTKAAQLAHDEATNTESRAESKYDTHSQEAAYLAEGQARLATEAIEAIKMYHTLELPALESDTSITLGALIAIGSTKQFSWYFLGPRAGGLELEDLEHNPVLLITPHSPLGRQLIGKKQGESVKFPGAKGSIQSIITVK